MWLWQRKNIHKRHLLWLKLFGVCLFFHCTFLFWIFFISHDSYYKISVSLNKHIDYSAPILFVPIVTTAPIRKNIPLSQSTQKKQLPTKQPKLSVKQLATPPTTIAAGKPIAEKKLLTPAAQAKPIPKPVIALPIKKIIAQPKTLPFKTNASETNGKSAGSTHESEKRIIPENAQTSNDYREVEAMRRNALLQKELINNWKPPLGVPASAECEIAFFVNNKGIVKEVTMIKNSGIMMYDLSARHALFAMKMPQWTHEKTLTIIFKQ